MMATAIIITDVTRMKGKRVCVAGVNEEGQSIRPVFEFRWIMEDWLYDGDCCVIRPFAKISLRLIEHRPQPPHTEDWVVSEGERDFHGLLDYPQRRAMLQKIADPGVADIFGTEIHDDPGYYVIQGKGIRSLGTVFARFVRAVKHACYEGKWDYRMGFDDFKGNTYWLSVTDLSFRYYLDFLRVEGQMAREEIESHLTQQLRKSAVFLRIGLARGWEKYPDRCHLQITGVYTFPDYLDGRCFADFQPRLDFENLVEGDL